MKVLPIDFRPERVVLGRRVGVEGDDDLGHVGLRRRVLVHGRGRGDALVLLLGDRHAALHAAAPAAASVLLLSAGHDSDAVMLLMLRLLLPMLLLLTGGVVHDEGDLPVAVVVVRRRGRARPS